MGRTLVSAWGPIRALRHAALMPTIVALMKPRVVGDANLSMETAVETSWT